MMRSHVAHHQAQAARPPAMSEGEARAAWRGLLAETIELANAVRGAGGVSRDRGAMYAGKLVRRTPPFPLRHASAQNAADAFLTLARGFVASGFATATAGFVRAGAECLDAMLTQDGHARAAAGRRVLGEDT